ncbi:MAG: hypothetical protein QOE55_2316, partial [Acidobacteriaceae bacterium]|nr:hypothetical protein [Acidobacteriaceae bacterium]
MADNQNGDRIWLVLCTFTGVAVDVTLNKYSSLLPTYAVLLLWCIPAAIFLFWVWRVERVKSWAKERFLNHPFSYVLLFIVFAFVCWQAVNSIRSRLTTSSRSPTTQTTGLAEADRLAAKYRAAHSDHTDLDAERNWVNQQLKNEGLPAHESYVEAPWGYVPSSPQCPSGVAHVNNSTAVRG